MIEVLVGPIASGKSTYAARRARQGAIVVSDDALTMMLHANQYHLYNNDLKRLYKTIETSVITAAVSQNRDVVIDKTNGKRRTRARYVALADTLDTQAFAILFDRLTPLGHAVRRTQADPRGLTLSDWRKVAERHEAEFEPVTMAEGFWDIRPAPPYEENHATEKR
jgi:predicted kinase